MIAAPEDEGSGANVLAISKIESNVPNVSFSSGLEARKAMDAKAKNAYSTFGGTMVV